MSFAARYRSLGDSGDPIDYTDIVGVAPGCLVPNITFNCDVQSPTYGCYRVPAGMCQSLLGAWGAASPTEDWCCPDGFGPGAVPAGDCASDWDCPGSERCMDGVCAEPVGPAPEPDPGNGTDPSTKTPETAADAYERGKDDERSSFYTYTIVSALLTGLVGYGLAKVLP